MDYYELLEVNPKASIEIIKKVYKIQIKKYHPDLFKGEAKIQAEEKVIKLNEAYEVLSNEFKRYEYDKSLDNIENKKYKTDYENNEDQYNNLVFQNDELKQMLINKQQIIDHFLGNIDLSEFENIQHAHNNVVHKTPKSSNADIIRYYLSIIFKTFYKIFLLILIIIFIWFMLNILKR